MCRSTMLGVESLVAALAESDDEQMLPAAAYMSDRVLAWELRSLFAGGWMCLGRESELLGPPGSQRALMVGDVAALLVRDRESAVRLFANTCRHRGHELLPVGSALESRAVTCPYHAWSYDLDGRRIAAPGFSTSAEQLDLIELQVASWHGWLFADALNAAESFADHVGELEQVVAPYSPASLALGARHTYEVAANWKVIAENYHECYHCPLIHPELCEISPPTSGDNYDLPGAWVGGRMDLRPGMATMSLTGASGGRPIPGVPSDVVEYVHLLPNLLISAHPDYVMTHRLVPLAPGKTWVECSWYFVPDESGAVPDPAYAVDFWELTNRQDWAACESVQRGLANPHFTPGPFAPNEDAVADFVSLMRKAYAND